MRIVTSVEAQNRFGELLDNAQREPVSITRHGRSVAYIISSEAYRNLTKGIPANTEMVAGYLSAIDVFRKRGRGEATSRLLADRKADKARET